MKSKILLLLFLLAPMAHAETITWATTSNGNDNLGVTDSGKAQAMPFVLTGNASSIDYSVTVLNYINGSADGRLRVSIQGDNSGEPDGTNIAYTDTFASTLPHYPADGTCVANGGGATTGTITGSFTAGTQYYLVLTRVGDTTDYLIVCSNDATADGLLIRFTGGWTTLGATLKGYLSTAYVPPPPPDVVSTWLNDNSALFASTSGFSIASTVSWTGSNLIGLFLGNGLDILYENRMWLIVCLIIGGILVFTYRAFRFFKH